MHTFEEKSLTVDLINSLLYNYWLPIYDTVQPGDYIIADNFYIYLNNVIKCTESGYLGGKYLQSTRADFIIIDTLKTYDELIEKYDIDATDYSDAILYKVDDQCIYEGTLYKCLINLTLSESWTPSHWAALITDGDYVRVIYDYILMAESITDDDQRLIPLKLKYKDSIVKEQFEYETALYDLKIYTSGANYKYYNLDEDNNVPVEALTDAVYIYYYYNNYSKYYQYVLTAQTDSTIKGEFLQQTTLSDFYYNKATFTTLWKYRLGGKYRKFTDNFIATDHNYTSDIHERLGKFVRVYSDISGTDLRPYYNCNSNRYVDNFYISKYNLEILVAEDIIDTSLPMKLSHSPVVRNAFLSGTSASGKVLFNDIKVILPSGDVYFYNLTDDGLAPLEAVSRGGQVKYKYTKVDFELYDQRTTKRVLIVPIRFNHTYTVALDCSGLVLICPVFLSHERKLILKDMTKTSTAEQDIDVTAEFLNATHLIFNFPSMSFSKPEYIEVSCKDVNTEQYYRYLNNLYLLVQLPENSTTSVTILEGKYTSNFTEYVDNDLIKNTAEKKIPNIILNQEKISKLTNFLLNRSLTSNLSLLMFNLNMQIPFANRLVEYLFDNVIDSTWKLDTNIEQAQSLLTNVNTDELDKGIWSPATRLKMFLYASSYKNSRRVDLSGNIDRETERLLLASPYNTGSKF